MLKIESFLEKCDKKILNKLAEDDDMDVFSGVRN